MTEEVKSGGRKIRAMVVPRGNDFPVRRKAACCGKLCKKGESVIVIPYTQAGTIVGYSILHRRCIFPIVDAAPLDASDYESRFQSLKNEISSSGDPFPDNKKVMRRG